ncbi:energy-coupling factor transporter transmembrane protein EcfT [Pseudorhodobacter sp. E13]|uniref:CbiQ family ECF transporter T component n=1 Tax=Pseudorhodobacter sp. E13 TaxID=2487931 RepID=UPI000F8E5D0A|nr:CbiQ family ECF transporter T component [Pseudorhodobacter sp. E13]RUS58586.1 energy-coupling factor transporter transmembrane protein EcfT [Pseudorhodobacter sp. E13]
MLTLTSPFETPLHRLPAGLKLAALALASIGLMAMQSLWALGVAGVAVVCLYLAFGRGFAGYGLRLLRPLWPFVLIIALWHGWTGEFAAGGIIAGRLLLAVALANLVTMTTRLEDMMTLVERLARPLARFGLSPRVLAVAVALVVRFTPVLMDKAGQLMQAWRARSARRVNWRIVLPISLMALDEADHVAEAIRARGGLSGP